MSSTEPRTEPGGTTLVTGATLKQPHESLLVALCCFIDNADLPSLKLFWVWNFIKGFLKMKTDYFQ